ncbi:hypothetical protein BJ944DRAFT_263843 [Cunninghamella echinulata]|nr:hypothetical protein BJ944DRAFT_263843 [Cunninghamella echinulata]
MTLFQSFNTLFDLTYSWGPSIYMLGISSLLLLFGCIGFAAHCWSDRPKYKRKAIEAIQRQRTRRRRRQVHRRPPPPTLPTHKF